MKFDLVGWRGARGDFDQPRHHLRAGKTARVDSRLDGDRSVFEGRLADGRLVKPNVGQGGVAPNDDRVNRRAAIQRGRVRRQVGGVAVGEQENARHGLAAPQIGGGAQGAAQGGAAPREIQIAEIADVLEMRVKRIAPRLEIFLQRGLPAVRVVGQRAPQQFAARLQPIGIVDAHALAVVGQEREEIGARFGALAHAHGFQHTQRQERHAGQFEQAAAQPDGTLGGAAVSRPNQRQRDGNRQGQNGEKPGAG